VALMKHTKILALGGAALAASLAVAPGAAIASKPAAPATIRIEGKTKTLLATTKAIGETGSITKGGAAKGACPGDTAQGALDVATHHRWSGKWFGSYNEYEIFTILGDTESGTKSFWEIFVNNVAATSGACEIKLHPGEQLLFATVPVKGTDYPSGLTAPATAKVGHAFTAKVVGYNAKGKAAPLAGAVVDGKKTNAHGLVQIVPTKKGTLKLQATRKGYIRSASVQVKVS
jgi:hypothetical protein